MSLKVLKLDKGVVAMAGIQSVPDASKNFRIAEKFRNLSKQLLMVNGIRYIVALARYIVYVRILHRLRVFDGSGEGVAQHTVPHNMKGLKDLSVCRSLKLIRPLSVIEAKKNTENMRVLTIGPRTEGEILSLISYGFSSNNIKGLDLISYSPWIDLGDMHQMPYADNQFDAVILGWVIAYSEDRYRAAQEVIRVASNGALIAVGVEKNPKSNEELLNELGYLPSSESRIDGVQDVLDLFKDAVDEVYFKQEVIPERRDQKSSICVIFSVKK